MCLDTRTCCSASKELSLYFFNFWTQQHADWFKVIETWTLVFSQICPVAQVAAGPVPAVVARIVLIPWCIGLNNKVRGCLVKLQGLKFCCQTTRSVKLFSSSFLTFDCGILLLWTCMLEESLSVWLHDVALEGFFFYRGNWQVTPFLETRSHFFFHTKNKTMQYTLVQ